MYAKRKKTTWLISLFFVLSCCCFLGVAAEEQEKKSFSIVLLPDTQFYSETYHETYKIQTQWIRDNIEEQNIQCVIHLGDIVQNHNHREEEWKIAREAHRFLDGVVPVSLAPGNHDMDTKLRDTTLFNRYFPVSDFEKFDWYGGHFSGKNDSNYILFETGGMKFLVMNLEYSPNEQVLQWADQIVKQHDTRRVIVATHRYMGPSGRNDDGDTVWDRLVRQNDNILLVVCGHVGALTLQTSMNDSGKLVYEMLTDYQSMKNGGDGWLRVLQFIPEQNVIHVGEYSPLSGQSKREIYHNYRLFYSMTENE